MIQYNKIRGVSGDKTRGTGQRGNDRLPKPNEKPQQGLQERVHHVSDIVYSVKWEDTIQDTAR